MSIGLVAAAFLGLVVLVVGKVMLDMIGKEIEARLPGLCFAVLRLARWRLPAEMRAELHDEALLEDELRTILFHTYQEKPITSLAKGLRFASGCVTGARRNARAAGWTPRQHHQPGQTESRFRPTLAAETPLVRAVPAGPIRITDRSECAGTSQSDGKAHFLAQPMMFTALALTWSPRSAAQSRTFERTGD
jgi:hypothetical protein